MNLGIDLLLEENRSLIKGKRIGVLTQRAGGNARGERTLARLKKNESWEVAALFGPEHGLTTLAQDMEAVPASVDEASRLPVYSLYGGRVLAVFAPPAAVPAMQA